MASDPPAFDREPGDPVYEPDFETWWVPVRVFTADADDVHGLLGPFDTEEQAREAAGVHRHGHIHLA